jgi:hypothetical protein
MLPLLRLQLTLDRLAKEIPPFRNDLCTFTAHRCAEDAEPGQIWSIKSNRRLPNDVCQNGWFLICERHGKVSEKGLSFTVAPLFENPAFAHERDAVLPSSLLGFAAGIAMGSSLEVGVTLLDNCVASPPADFARALIKCYEHVGDPLLVDWPREVRRGMPLIEGLRARRDKFHADLSDELDFLRPVQSFDASIKRYRRGLKLWLQTEHPGLLPHGHTRVRLEAQSSDMGMYETLWVFKLRPFGYSIECTMAPDTAGDLYKPLWCPDAYAFQNLLKRHGNDRLNLQLTSSEWILQISKS